MFDASDSQLVASCCVVGSALSAAGDIRFIALRGAFSNDAADQIGCIIDATPPWTACAVSRP